MKRLEHLHWTKKIVYQRYAERCVNAGLEPDHYNSFVRKLAAGGGKFRLEEFRPLLEAFQLYDLDLFLDACYDASVHDVVFISEDQWEITGGQQNRSTSAHAGDLKSNRTRLDFLILAPGQDTGWKSHGGHEFVRVVSGTVRCAFALTKECPQKEDQVEQRKLVATSLWQGPAVAFPSKLWHRFWNDSRESVHLAVARPTHSSKNT